MQKGRLSRNSRDFIAEARIPDLLAEQGAVEDARLEEILQQSLARTPLDLEQTACLLRASEPRQIDRILATARQLKRDVYGNRIVLFAPLYVGNECVNDCSYCGFRRSNREAQRQSLEPEELEAQVRALQRQGHKRLILVFGEHPDYDARYIAETVESVYRIREGRGEIRRVNINAAPMDHDGFREVVQAGIGTWQIFQETYDPQSYARVHPAQTRKGDYQYRLDSLSRAFEAGCEDVGIGVLFGLSDWRGEVLGLVAHSRYLLERYGVGAHTISVPRLQPASGLKEAFPWRVGDEDFLRLTAILRCAVPYTGLIVTARESARVRREALELGVSQIDAGSCIELGGYTRERAVQHLDREQFELGDMRSLDEVIHDLLAHDHIPSFCTACYRVGRTGEEFMEYAIPGFIEQYCTPNGLLTLCEYLQDYAGPQTRKAGESCIARSLKEMKEGPLKRKLVLRLEELRETEVRDLYF